MKKDIDDYPELQLQKYTWQADAPGEKQAAPIMAAAAAIEPRQIKNETPEYRH